MSLFLSDIIVTPRCSSIPDTTKSTVFDTAKYSNIAYNEISIVNTMLPH